MVQISGDGRNGPPPEVDLRSQLRKLVEGLKEEVAGLRQEVERLRREVTALNDRDEPDILEASLSPAEVADRLGISRRTLDDLERLDSDKDGITAVQVKGQVRYEPQEVADFIRRNRREDGSR